MDCAYFRTLGSAIVDNEATEAETNEFNQHILTCADCAEWFEAIKILKEGSAELLTEPPKELKQRVMQGVTAEKKGKPSILSRFRFTGIAAAVAIIIFAINGFMGPETPAPVAVNDAAPVAARIAGAPDKILPAEKSSEKIPEIPYDRAFSYAVYIADDSAGELLKDLPFEEIDGYKYYITTTPYEALNDTSHEILSFNLSLGTEGLIITNK